MTKEDRAELELLEELKSDYGSRGRMTWAQHGRLAELRRQLDRERAEERLQQRRRA